MSYLVLHLVYTLVSGALSFSACVSLKTSSVLIFPIFFSSSCLFAWLFLFCVLGLLYDFDRSSISLLMSCFKVLISLITS
jgi:hypothetical protein